MAQCQVSAGALAHAPAGAAFTLTFTGCRLELPLFIPEITRPAPLTPVDYIPLLELSGTHEKPQREVHDDMDRDQSAISSKTHT